MSQVRHVPNDRRALTMSGRAIMRTSGIYAIGSAVAVPVSILSLAVTTRYLSVAEFGRLAALFALAALITFVANLGSLQGTLIRVYGTSGEGGEGADGAADDLIVEETVVSSVKEGRRMLGSGIVITVVASVAVGGVALSLESPIGRGLLHTEDFVAVRLAILCGATGAIWRLVQQVYRMERRPVAHSVLGTARPVIVIALIILALIQGWGVHGILGATAIGTALAIVIAIGITRRYYRLRPRFRDVIDIYGPGLAFAPIVIVGFARSHVDVLLLTQVSAAREVGLYTVATRIAQIPIYFSSAFLMAWAPLERSPIFQATIQRLGRPAFAGTLFTYLALVNLALLVALTLGADLLIALAAPRFESAAALIPFVAAAAMAYTTFYALFRACRCPWRRTSFVLLSIMGLGFYVAASVALVPRFGSYAVAAASTAAATATTAALAFIDRRTGGSVDVPWRRLMVAIALAAITVASVSLSNGLGSELEGVLHVAGILFFPIALIGLGIVPRTRLNDLRTIAGELVPLVAERRAILRRWPSLSADEQRVMALLVRDRRPVASAAEHARMPQAIMQARLVRALRRLAQVGPALPVDDRVGEYLLSNAPRFERDRQAQLLAEMGATLEDLHELELAYVSLRRLRQSRFPPCTS